MGPDRLGARRLNCVVPLTLRLRGRPDTAALAELAAAVERQVRSRLAAAEAEIERRFPARSGDVGREIVREGFDVERWEVRAGGYRIPSYEGGGALATVALEGDLPAGSVERIEIHRGVGRLLVFFRDHATPLVLTLVEEPRLVASESYRWALRDGSHQLTTGDRDDIVVRFRGSKRQLAALTRGLAGEVDGVPVVVVDDPPRAGAGSSDDRSSGGAGEAASPLRGDLGLLAGRPELTALFLDLLQRFAGVDVSGLRATLGDGGPSEDEVESLLGDSDKARVVALFFTQGWSEYTAAGESDITGFGILEQIVLTQRQRGNFNALRNRLEIGSDRDGPGIFLRGTGMRLYDRFGQPLPSFGGGFLDEGFLAFEPPRAAIRVTIRDRGLLQVLRAVQQTGVDQTAIVVQAVQGYVDNSKLLWPRVRNGWALWEGIEKEMRQQLPGLVIFLSLHLVALVSKRSGSPYGLLVGDLIEAVLVGAGWAFNIVFVGSLLVLALRAGQELSLVERDEAGRLDPLSERHLENAVQQTRRLLEASFAAGLTATSLRLARETALTLPSGGGGPTPAPAVATAGPRRASPAAGPPAPAAVATGPPPQVPLPPAAVVPPQLEMSGMGRGSGGSGRGPGGRSGRRPRTGAELEGALVGEFETTKKADSRRFFGRSKIKMGAFVRQLRAHVRQQRRQGNDLGIGPIREAVLRQRTAEFIRDNPRLHALWERWQRQVADELSRLAIRRREAAGDRASQRFIDRRIQRQEKRLEELDRFERGRVGRKEMDIVELFFEDRRARITDVTLKTFDPQHNFKTLFYIEVIKALLGWTDVSGSDLRSGRIQRPIE